MTVPVLTIPVLAVLGFAVWTLLILFGTVGVYRWRRILTGRTRIGQWTADPDGGTGVYPRAMRAHMNCIENLPVFLAIVFAVDRAGLAAPALDTLALTVLGARMAQSTVHIALAPSDGAAYARFGFYFVQILAMFAMVAILIAAL
ncbi:MAPEG family protein [Zavarzinia compransoris]|uniref:MAPEG family protein n=1 Tax=Zavarzinia marina TaxID=2911065 RepID=UPI001F31A1A7|nr:MAPEG family protein [Zavarzinia marina]MCF4164887.1 MAPEG family protein [Zavarzinia marina]